MPHKGVGHYMKGITKGKKQIGKLGATYPEQMKSDMKHTGKNVK